MSLHGSKIWHPRLAIVLHDLSMVWLAWMSVLWVRYLMWPDSPPLQWFPREMTLVLLAQSLVLYYTGLYKGMWRFASLPDLWNIVRASIYGTLLISLGLFLFSRLEGVPRSVFLLYPIALVFLLGGPRLLYRVWKDHRLGLISSVDKTRVLIIGAGVAGEMLVRDLQAEGRYQPVGFLDDEPRHRGAKLRGLPVYGGVEQLESVAERTAAEMAIIAIPSATNEQMQRIVGICEASGLRFRTVPRLQDMVAGEAQFGDLKRVAIEDLLGREPVQIDWSSISADISGKCVLVTGGGGSIGSELCRQIARLDPARLVILERTEFNLYSIELELRNVFPDLVLDVVLGDVCDERLVSHILRDRQPQLVLHAAACKHVPLLESQPREAIQNNVLGTATVLQACDAHEVGTFVLISTDKAVNPVNVMGATKRAAEIVCQNFAARSKTRVVTVRFGNVLDSAGSVVPLFRQQIESGGPVTVTHPDVERYFMTIPEACQLILQAGAIGKDGGIYVLDMGAPVRIQYLAEQMIRLTGREPNQDIEIVYSGLRTGEKLHEELFHEQEPYQETSHPQILEARFRPTAWEIITRRLDELDTAITNFDIGRLHEKLHALVPEYQVNSGDDASAPMAQVLNLKKTKQ